MNSPKTEVRYNDKGTLDEIVSSEATLVHLEQMDTDIWWLGIDLPGDQIIRVFLSSNSDITAWVRQE